MAGGTCGGPLGCRAAKSSIDGGTLSRTTSPRPGTVGGAHRVSASGAVGKVAAKTTDPAIEALGLRGAARHGAYALKKAHASVTFTSGRRNKADQARAMASNVVLNRKWIEQTYATSAISQRCQQWVDEHPDSATKEEIAAGLLGVFDAAKDAELARLSRHLSGDAFDVQPVVEDAGAIKATIRGLAGLRKFLEKEGGLVRWHAEF